MRKIKNFKSILKSIIFLLIAIWFLLSLIRNFNNFYRFFRDEISIIKLSDNQKSRMIFGDAHDFLKFVEHNTSNHSKILLLTSEGKENYLSKYYLYPRLISFLASPDKANGIIMNSKFDYLIVYEKENFKLNTIFYNNEFLKNKQVIIYSGDKTSGKIYKL
jgi:hypothetical protein